jgi:biotin transport system substrate-specific component
MLKNLRFSPSSTIDFAIKYAVGLIALCLLSPIEISSGLQVAFTPQSLLVVLIPLLFGWKIGIAAVVSYLLLGGLGLPVFSGYSSGWDRFTGLSGGFLLAFPISALIIGYVGEQNHRIPSLSAALLLLLGQLLILLLGLYWMLNLMNESVDWVNQLKGFAPGILIKSALGLIIYIILRRLAARMETKSASEK